MLSMLSISNELYEYFCRMDHVMTLVVIKLWTLCWIPSCVTCCGDHAHQILSCLHIRTESYGNCSAPQPPVKTARQNLSYGIFSGMIMLEIDSELNTNLRAYEILHLLTKNENFLVYKWGPCVVQGPVDGRFLVVWVINNVVWTDSWLSIAGAGCGLTRVGAGEEQARKVVAGEASRCGEDK
jgi:hypothetical protein